MSDDTSPVKRGPGRPPRIEEVKAERRRRHDPAENGQGPLGLNQSKMDPAFHYHWINDNPGRLHQYTVNDDYDKVEDPSLALSGDNTEGTAVRRLVGAHQDGKPKYAYLCRKPIEFYTKDRAEKQHAVNDLESQIKKGQVPDGLSKDNSYVPDDMGSPVQIVRPEPKRGTQSYEP